MRLDDSDLALISERLVADFGDLIAFRTIISVLHDCLAEDTSGSADLVEQAARFRLHVQRQGLAASP